MIPRKLVCLAWMVLLLMSAGCGTEEPETEPASLCFDGVKNGAEIDTDCGGACDACPAEPTCRDGAQNGDEEGVDCGGVCRACETETGTCDDGTQNGDETDVDCGGSCAACLPAATCDDGMQNGGEQGVDCGGTCAACPAVPTCTDGLQNGNETAVDCGGSCARCRLAAPVGWLCPDSSYDDERCNCGCGVIDEDCPNALAASCEGSACPLNLRADPNDNTQCVAYPELPGNLSFEVTPPSANVVPEWTIVRKNGTSDLFVVGPAQTTAPDGSRALWMTSTYRYDPVGMMGFPSPAEIASSPFIPTGTQCDLTLALGDATGVGSNSDFGSISVIAVGLPAPLNVLARTTIDTRGGANSVAPSADTYEDVVLSFTHDGMNLLQVVIVVDASFNTKAFHVDDLRLTCM